MKAASETNRSLAGTIMYDCFKVVGMTNCFCWAPLLSVPSSSFMLTNSGLFNVNPANFSTPALKVADNMTVCRWPIPPSFSKCSDTKPSILEKRWMSSIYFTWNYWPSTENQAKMRALRGFVTESKQRTLPHLFHSQGPAIDQLHPKPATEVFLDSGSLWSSNGLKVDLVWKPECWLLCESWPFLIFSSLRPSSNWPQPTWRVSGSWQTKCRFVGPALELARSPKPECQRFCQFWGWFAAKFGLLGWHKLKFSLNQFGIWPKHLSSWVEVELMNTELLSFSLNEDPFLMSQPKIERI